MHERSSDGYDQKTKEDNTFVRVLPMNEARVYGGARKELPTRHGNNVSYEGGAFEGGGARVCKRERNSRAKGQTMKPLKRQW